VLSVTGLLTAVLVAVLTVLPANYAIGGAGPTFDTLGEKDGMALVSIQGAPTYEASGELRLTTVSVVAAGSRPFTMGRVIRGYFAPSEYVVPQETVFGTPEEKEQVEEQARQDWISSQEAATVSALEALGEEVPAELVVVDAVPDTGAVGVFQPDDVIIAVDGQPVPSFASLSGAIDVHSPGERLAVQVLRAGVPTDLEVVLTDGGDGTPIVGVWIDPIFDLPVDVTVAIDSVGGPSAGMMFSLAIMDKLTPEDELNGASVAGTGAITADGDVLPIGGIRLKMFGALDDGATYFLSPVENCNEVVGHIPEGLSVVAVDTLDDAYAAITRIGSGDVAGLPTCEANG
jgi:PDZ domain-containing protein